MRGSGNDKKRRQKGAEKKDQKVRMVRKDKTILNTEAELKEK